MARRYVYVDDLTGKELDDEVQPIRLSLGRRAWSLHLSDESTTKLYEALEPFTKDAEVADSSPYTAPTAAATGTGGSTGTRRRRTPEEVAEAERVQETKKEQREDIAAWAKTQNDKGTEPQFKIPGDRGRIESRLIEAYYEANKEAEKVWL